MQPVIRLGTLRQWHWISSALCLAGMLLFAVTGITLNNASHISAQPTVITVQEQLPEALLTKLKQATAEQRMPISVHGWINQQLGSSVSFAHAEWSSNELYLALPRPGGDGWLSIDLESGELLFESTDRGWIAYFNDLHKGRNTGAAWSWFIDLFAAVCVVFSLTGLWLLLRQSTMRPRPGPSLWPGLLIPVLIMLLFIH